MTVYRFVDGSRLIPTELADRLAAPRTRHITEDKVDAFRQQGVDGANYLEWVCAFGTDALIELIQARLDEEDDPEGWNDFGVSTAAVACNYQSRLLH